MKFINLIVSLNQLKFYHKTFIIFYWKENIPIIRYKIHIKTSIVFVLTHSIQKCGLKNLSNNKMLIFNILLHKNKLLNFKINQNLSINIQV